MHTRSLPTGLALHACITSPFTPQVAQGMAESCKCCGVVNFIEAAWSATSLSLKNAFRARPPSKIASWSCRNKAFVQDLPQKLQLQLVKTKLSCETSLLWDFFAVRLLCCETPCHGSTDFYTSFDNIIYVYIYVYVYIYMCVLSILMTPNVWGISKVWIFTGVNHQRIRFSDGYNGDNL